MTKTRSRGGRALLFFLAWLFLLPSAPADAEGWEVSDYGWFIAGGLAGFVVHESSHMIVAESYGLRPHVGTRREPVPFVVIRYGFSSVKDSSGNFHYLDREGQPLTDGAEKQFSVAAAGINSQNITSELILTLDPEIREERRPFLKGVLAFDILTSLGYALFGRLDPDGDLRGMSESSGIDNRVIAGLVFLPAALDLYRYYYPESVWSPWVSRAAKAYQLGLSIRW